MTLEHIDKGRVQVSEKRAGIAYIVNADSEKDALDKIMGQLVCKHIFITYDAGDAKCLRCDHHRGRV